MGWGHEISRDIENIDVKILGVNKEEVEFSGVIKKTSGISVGLVFGYGNSNGCNTIVWNFQG